MYKCNWKFCDINSIKMNFMFCCSQDAKLYLNYFDGLKIKDVYFADSLIVDGDRWGWKQPKTTKEWKSYNKKTQKETTNRDPKSQNSHFTEGIFYKQIKKNPF
jgi:hypothetical protein